MSPVPQSVFISGLTKEFTNSDLQNSQTFENHGFEFLNVKTSALASLFFCHFPPYSPLIPRIRCVG